MASDKELRVLADKIDVFFNSGLPEMNGRLERIESIYLPEIIDRLKRIKATLFNESLDDSGKTEALPEYHGDIEPSNIDEDMIAFGKPDPMTDDMPVGPGTTTDDIEALSEDSAEAPEPIDVFKDEQMVGSGQLAPDPSLEDADGQEEGKAFICEVSTNESAEAPGKQGKKNQNVEIQITHIEISDNSDAEGSFDED